MDKQTALDDATSTRKFLQGTCDAQLEQCRRHLLTLEKEARAERKRVRDIIALKAAWGLYDDDRSG